MSRKQKRKIAGDEYEPNLKKRVGERFRLFRESRDMTQKELGGLLALAECSVANIETGKNKPRIEHLLHLRGAFKLNTNWLIGGEGFMNFPPEIPENCRELFYYMQVPEFKARMFFHAADIKRIFSEELEAALG